MRSVRRGAARGLSGMTRDHLRPLWESTRDLHLLFQLGEFFARGQIPVTIANIVRRGRMTALRKDGGGVRGIVVGEVIRRLTARTIAQQLAPAVEACIAPFQYALSTRAGCEHRLSDVDWLDPEATVTSIDGISAYNSTSRRAMSEGLARVPGGAAVLPFVRIFYAELPAYIWEDDVGTVHTTPLSREKEESRETPSCRSSSRWVNIPHWRHSNNHARRSTS